MTRRTLLLGYGNTLRGDAGAGVRTAQELSRLLPEADLVLRQELQLELAETIAQYEDVFFIDASSTSERGLQARPVVPEGSIPNTGLHTCTPGALLALCRSLYGCLPTRVMILSIPAGTFAFGEELSEFTREKVAEGVALILGMVRTR